MAHSAISPDRLEESGPVARTCMSPPVNHPSLWINPTDGVVTAVGRSRSADGSMTITAGPVGRLSFMGRGGPLLCREVAMNGVLVAAAPRLFEVLRTCQTPERVQWADVDRALQQIAPAAGFTQGPWVVRHGGVVVPRRQPAHDDASSELAVVHFDKGSSPTWQSRIANLVAAAPLMVIALQVIDGWRRDGFPFACQVIDDALHCALVGGNDRILARYPTAGT